MMDTVEDKPWGCMRPGLSTKAALQIAGLLWRFNIRGWPWKAVRRGLSKRPVDLTIDDLRWRCHAGDNTTELGLAVHGAGQDRDGVDRITEGLQPGDVFVDVGANCGLYTLNAARKVGETGRVVAIEAMPEMVRRLQFNVQANGFNNVSICASAIDDQPGTLTLYVRSTQRGMSSVAQVPGREPIVVPAVAFPDLVASLGLSRIDAMKLDIEGHEDRVVSPMLARMSEECWPRRILLEKVHASRWKEDCVEALSSAGYVVRWSDDNDCLLELV